MPILYDACKAHGPSYTCKTHIRLVLKEDKYCNKEFSSAFSCVNQSWKQHASAIQDFDGLLYFVNLSSCFSSNQRAQHSNRVHVTLC